jgi:SAM-dependent methyltransferase
MTLDSNRQKLHYERIHDEYESHYFDDEAIAYRRRFMLGPLTEGLDLNGKLLADLASGSGHNTLLLRDQFPDMRAEGFDISSDACRAYEKYTGFPAHEVDLTKAGSVREHEGRFDAALVMGGLHHCVADLPTTIDNVARLLKPGAHFMMFEPNAAYALEAARKVWYKNDQLFDAETERALTHDELIELAGDRFDADLVEHLGGPAYFLVLNSMVFRIPKPVKRRISGPTMALEALWNKATKPFTSAYFIARWQKRS